MANPLVKKDLVDAILELRADVEKQLQTNKYYVALNKLDELLAAIRPLEIVEATPCRSRPRGKRLHLRRSPSLRPSRPGPGRGSSRKRWSRARRQGSSRLTPDWPQFRFDS